MHCKIRDDVILFKCVSDVSSTFLTLFRLGGARRGGEGGGGGGGRRGEEKKKY